MSTVDFAAREINFKIIYYGPGMSGKTTNIKRVYEQIPDTRKGELVSLATEEERTLFFDFMPLELGTVGGFKTRFHLYTVPGQVFYNAARKLILRGVDGIVFVADSAPNRLRANAESLRNLRENLRDYGSELADVPLVLQFNKRDLPNALPTAMLATVLNPDGALTSLEASAVSTEGVMETLRAVSQQVLAKLAQAR
jgi:signal recognition particle receptor subunit beta